MAIFQCKKLLTIAAIMCAAQATLSYSNEQNHTSFFNFFSMGDVIRVDQVSSGHSHNTSASLNVASFGHVVSVNQVGPGRIHIRIGENSSNPFSSLLSGISLGAAVYAVKHFFFDGHTRNQRILSPEQNNQQISAIGNINEPTHYEAQSNVRIINHQELGDRDRLAQKDYAPIAPPVI